jgi:hypothetical protein
MRDNDIDLEPDELGGNLGEALATALRPAIFNRDVATLDPAELAQPLQESGDPVARGGRRGHAGKPNGRQPARLLRARRERQAGRRTSEQHNDVSPPH